MSDLEMLRRVMLLDPWDDLAIQAYCDEHEARAGWRPSPLAEWKGTLEEFLGGGLGALFERNPVREVTLADKEPYRLGGPDRPAGWFWAKVSGGSLPKTRPHWMPGEVLDDPVWKAAPRVWSTSPVYEGREQAMAAMSLALTNYGRSLAGLPPLPPRA